MFANLSVKIVHQLILVVVDFYEARNQERHAGNNGVVTSMRTAGHTALGPFWKGAEIACGR